MPFTHQRLSAVALAVALTVSGLIAVAVAGPAAADGPGSGAPWGGVNPACSGAKAATFTGSDGYFKPGLDFSGTGLVGGEPRMALS